MLLVLGAAAVPSAFLGAIAKGGLVGRWVLRVYMLLLGLEMGDLEEPVNGSSKSSADEMQ